MKNEIIKKYLSDKHILFFYFLFSFFGSVSVLIISVMCFFVFHTLLYDSTYPILPWIAGCLMALCFGVLFLYEGIKGIYKSFVCKKIDEYKNFLYDEEGEKGFRCALYILAMFLIFNVIINFIYNLII